MLDAIKYDEQRKIDLEKDGWILLSRCRWSNYVALTKREKEKYIASLKNAIENKTEIEIISPNVGKADKLLSKSSVRKDVRVQDPFGRQKVYIPVDELERRKNLILGCGVNLKKFGWVGKVSEKTGLSKRQIEKIVKTYNLDVFVRNQNCVVTTTPK